MSRDYTENIEINQAAIERLQLEQQLRTPDTKKNFFVSNTCYRTINSQSIKVSIIANNC